MGILTKLFNKSGVQFSFSTAQETPKNPQDKLGDPITRLLPETIDRDYRNRINRGELAIPTWALHEAIRLTPQLGNYVGLWIDALTGMDWAIKAVPDPTKPKGSKDKTDHDKRAELHVSVLRKAYDKLDVVDMVKHLALANVYGYSFLVKKHNKNEPLNWWNFARVGLYGDWKYNPHLRVQDGRNLPEESTIDMKNFICREVENNCLLQYLRLFLRFREVEGYWDDNLEKESKRQVVIIPGQGLTPKESEDFMAAAKNIALGKSGCLAPGTGEKTTQAVFPPESRGLPYYENRLDMLDELACKALFGAPLIANTSPGSGTLAGHAHSETAQKRIQGAAMDISSVLQRQFDRGVLESTGTIKPGEPTLAYFELVDRKAVDPEKEVEWTAELNTAGFERDEAEVSERTGMTLTKKAGPVAESTQLTVLPGKEQPAPAVATDVAATALNGAQVASLLEIVMQVSAKNLPTETALRVIQAAFPSLSSDVITTMLAPLKTFVPADTSLANRAGDELGVPASWLMPIRSMLADIVEKAESGKLSDAELTSYLEMAAQKIPELFEKMDVEAFAKFIENATSGAALEGVKDALKH